MVTGIIGRKVGMTQVFEADGTVIPGTVIKAGPCVIVQAKTVETDGYESVQLGLVDDKAPTPNKPTAGHFRKAAVPATRVRREVALAPGGDAPKPGDQVLLDIFTQGQRVDVIGNTRGRGFQGVMKRHNFAGGAATHGSMFHRAPGSIGASSYPSRVIKGMRGPGRMGGNRITTRNMQIVRIDPENHLLVLRGAVPGAPGGVVVIRQAVAAKPEPQVQAEKPKKGKK